MYLVGTDAAVLSGVSFNVEQTTFSVNVGPGIPETTDSSRDRLRGDTFSSISIPVGGWIRLLSLSGSKQYSDDSVEMESSVSVSAALSVPFTQLAKDLQGHCRF